MRSFSQMWNIFKLVIIYVYVRVSLCVLHSPWHRSGGRKTAFSNWFSPSIVWVPEIKLRSSTSAAAIYLLSPLTSLIFS